VFRLIYKSSYDGLLADVFIMVLPALSAAKMHRFYWIMIPHGE